MIRTGIFGGSFNPIHKGHVALAENVCAEGWVDEVWLLVSPQNPLKKRSDLLPDDVRLEMARRAVKGYPHLEVSDFEFGMPRPSYMFHTLEKLRETYPERIFTLLIGADNWLGFGRWYRAAEIVRDYPILIYPREDCEINETDLPENVHLLKGQRLYPVSATAIRERLQHGEDISAWMDKDVEAIFRNIERKKG